MFSSDNKIWSEDLTVNCGRVISIGHCWALLPAVAMKGSFLFGAMKHPFSKMDATARFRVDTTPGKTTVSGIDLGGEQKMPGAIF